MLVLKTTSPKVSPSAPKPRPVNTVPSSRASFATISDISPLGKTPGRGRARNSFYNRDRHARRPRTRRKGETMSTVKLAAEQFAFARAYTVRLLDSVAPDDWFREPPGGVSTIAWQVGHLAMAEYRLALERIRGRRPEDESLIPDEFLRHFARE